MGAGRGARDGRFTACLSYCEGGSHRSHLGVCGLRRELVATLAVLVEQVDDAIRCHGREPHVVGSPAQRGHALHDACGERRWRNERRCRRRPIYSGGRETDVPSPSAAGCTVFMWRSCIAGGCFRVRGAVSPHFRAGRRLPPAASGRAAFSARYSAMAVMNFRDGSLFATIDRHGSSICPCSSSVCPVPRAQSKKGQTRLLFVPAGNLSDVAFCGTLAEPPRWGSASWRPKRARQKQGAAAGRSPRLRYARGCGPPVARGCRGFCCSGTAELFRWVAGRRAPGHAA